MKSYKTIKKAMSAIENGTATGIIDADDVVTMESAVRTGRGKISARARHYYRKFNAAYCADIEDIQSVMNMAYYSLLESHGVVSRVSFYQMVTRELSPYRKSRSSYSGEAEKEAAEYNGGLKVKSVIINDYEGALLQYLEYSINDKYQELIRAHRANGKNNKFIPEDLKRFELLKDTERFGLFNAASVYESGYEIINY